MATDEAVPAATVPVSDGSDSEEESEQVKYKVIVLGDGAVGKTSLALRFAQDHFSQSYKQTVGLDWFHKILKLPGDVDVSLQIWDIGGQTISGKMINNYIHGADAVLLCYDITNYQSFANLEDWLRLVRRTFADQQMPFVALLGNKSDLNHLRTVKMERHRAFVDEHNAGSFFVSAKTGDAVNSSFVQIAAKLAGIELTKAEVEVNTRVVKAEIVNHPAALARSTSDDKEKKKKKNCVIQ